jgi:hypothetical protein
MISIVLSITSFAILKWAFLKLFELPQTPDISKSETQLWRPLGSVWLSQKIDKR